MHRNLLIVVIAAVVGISGCAQLTVTPAYRASEADIPPEQLVKLLARDEKDGVPPNLPYGWASADYVVVTSFDGKDLGKRGALLGAPVTGDFAFPKEVDFTPGKHTLTIGIMTGCGFMDLDYDLDAKAGVVYEAFGIIKSDYAVNYGSIGGGCQAKAPIYHQDADGEWVP